MKDGINIEMFGEVVSKWWFWDVWMGEFIMLKI